MKSKWKANTGRTPKALKRGFNGCERCAAILKANCKVVKFLSQSLSSDTRNYWLSSVSLSTDLTRMFDVRCWCKCEEESKGKLWWTDEKNHKMIKFPPMVQYKSHSGSHLLLSLCKRSVDSSSGISISSPSLHCTRTRAIQCDALQSIAIRESVYKPYRIFTTSFNMHFTMQTAIKNQ